MHPEIRLQQVMLFGIEFFSVLSALIVKRPLIIADAVMAPFTFFEYISVCVLPVTLRVKKTYLSHTANCLVTDIHIYISAKWQI